MEEQSWTVWSVLTALAGLLGAIVAAYFSETVRALLPDPRNVARRLRQSAAPAAPADRFRILLADLAGDDAALGQTRHVAAAFDDTHGFEIVKIGPGPQWDLGSRDQRDRQTRDLLARQHGDVLISGEVAKADEVLRLRILGAGSTVAAGGSYSLQDTQLPANFSTDFNAVLVAVAGAAAAPATESAGRYLADILTPAADKLARLTARMPEGLSADQRGTLQHALGLVSLVIGAQTGAQDRLETAATAFRAALEERTRDRVPLDWAQTQINLGEALRRLGERESGTARLEQAVAAFTAALKELTRDRVPLQWATTKANLAFALATLADRTGQSRDAALAEIDAALEVFRAAGAGHYVEWAERLRRWIAGG